MQHINLIDLPSPTPYGKIHDLQLEMLRRLKCREVPGTLILTEHTPVITLGRNCPADQILAGKEELKRLGVDRFTVERGGEATLHLPGQLVAYPIINIRALGSGVKDYVTKLEEVLIRTVADFNITARRIPRRPGIYTDEGKIGALGIAVTGGYVYHGVSLNVAPDLKLFGLIIPCGDTDGKVTSLERESNIKAIEIADIKGSFIEHFGDIFSFSFSQDG